MQAFSKKVSISPLLYCRLSVAQWAARSYWASLTRLYPSLARFLFFNTIGATSKIPAKDIMVNIPIPPLRLGPVNPISRQVSIGSQMISSYATGFKQCGPVQLALMHTQVYGFVLDWQIPLVAPPHDWGKTLSVGSATEHVPPPFWIAFNGCFWYSIVWIETTKCQRIKWSQTKDTTHIITLCITLKSSHLHLQPAYISSYALQ